MRCLRSVSTRLVDRDRRAYDLAIVALNDLLDAFPRTLRASTVQPEVLYRRVPDLIALHGRAVPPRALETVLTLEEPPILVCRFGGASLQRALPQATVSAVYALARGGSFPATIGRIEQGFRCRPDLCAVHNPVNPREYLRRVFVDALVHDARALRYLLDVMGSDRVALGSDYPFPLGEAQPGTLVRSMDLPGEAQEDLLFRTACNWLGVKPEDFD